VVVTLLSLSLSCKSFGDIGGPLPIMSCKQADKYPVNELCRDVVGNETISVQANLTILEEYVGKTFRSLIYVQDPGDYDPTLPSPKVSHIFFLCYRLHA